MITVNTAIITILVISNIILASALLIVSLAAYVLYTEDDK